MPYRTTLSDKDEIIMRLKKQTNYTNANHWLYTGGGITVDGYRKMTINKRRYSSARLSAYIYLGLDIHNVNIQANHKESCSYKNCWNPDCLYVGTHAQNMTDQVKKNEKAQLLQTHCINGHLLNGTYYSYTRGKTYRYCKICSKNKAQRVRNRTNAKN